MSKKDKQKDKNNSNQAQVVIPSKKVRLGDLKINDQLHLKGDVTGTIIQLDIHTLEVRIPDDYVAIAYRVDNGPFAGGFGTFFKPIDETTRVVLSAPEVRQEAVAKAVSKLNPLNWSFWSKKKDKNKKDDNNNQSKKEDKKD